MLLRAPGGGFPQWSLPGTEAAPIPGARARFAIVQAQPGGGNSSRIAPMPNCDPLERTEDEQKEPELCLKHKSRFLDKILGEQSAHRGAMESSQSFTARR